MVLRMARMASRPAQRAEEANVTYTATALTLIAALVFSHFGWTACAVTSWVAFVVFGLMDAKP
jgi:hypothetical protein